MSYDTSYTPVRQFASPAGQHVSLGGPLRALLFFIPAAVVGIVLYIALGYSGLSITLAIISWVVIQIIVSGLRVAAQWERGVVLRLGNFRGILGPGILYIVPFIDYVRFVDMRTLVLNIPSQRVITRDNVPAMIDGVLFFLVESAERAVLSIQEYQFAIAQYAQASLRDVVGGMTLDELLAEREKIQLQIAEIVEHHVREWGLHIDAIRLLDINLPEDLQKMMSRQASAEREKRATITKAEGDKLPAVNLSSAAATMLESPGAMQLRYLQTIDGLGPSSSNTVVLFPIEWIEGVKRALGQRLEPPKPPE